MEDEIVSVNLEEKISRTKRGGGRDRGGGFNRRRDNER